jgi:sulfur-oxidizing protein SoxY
MSKLLHQSTSSRQPRSPAALGSDGASVIRSARRIASLSRRAALGTAAALLASPGLAQPASIHDHLPWIPKMREDLGESRRVIKDRVVLDIAPLVDNGNVVPMSVTVQSAMQGADRVKSIRVYSEKNPQPRVVAFHFTEFSPEAKAATRIRLNGSQKLVAIAEMQDGTLLAGVTEVVVTVSACIDGT